MTRNYKGYQFKFIVSLIKTGMHIGIPVLFLALPADFFDYGQSISLFELAGVEDYYSKGITKAIMHLIHLDFETAWHYNKLSFIVLPLIGYTWGSSFLKSYHRTLKLNLLKKEAL